MAQVKVYGIKERLNPIKQYLSDIIHSCVMEAFKYPADKKFHRFIALNKEEFYYPEDRTENYLIIEISIFEGRSIEAKKELIRLLFDKISGGLNIATNDIEITIFETPKHNWGIRGVPGDEVSLNYTVEV